MCKCGNLVMLLFLASSPRSVNFDDLEFAFTYLIRCMLLPSDVFLLFRSSPFRYLEALASELQFFDSKSVLNSSFLFKHPFLVNFDSLIA